MKLDFTASLLPSLHISSTVHDYNLVPRTDIDVSYVVIVYHPITICSLSNKGEEGRKYRQGAIFYVID